jgi:hypothetical protein
MHSVAAPSLLPALHCQPPRADFVFASSLQLSFASRAVQRLCSVSLHSSPLALPTAGIAWPLLPLLLSLHAPTGKFCQLLAAFQRHFLPYISITSFRMPFSGGASHAALLSSFVLRRARSSLLLSLRSASSIRSRPANQQAVAHTTPPYKPSQNKSRHKMEQEGSLFGYCALSAASVIDWLIGFGGFAFAQPNVFSVRSEARRRGRRERCAFVPSQLHLARIARSQQ